MSVPNNEWLADQRSHLQLDGKASAEAKFQIVNWRGYLFRGFTIKPMYDISVGDPFAQQFEPCNL
jgi:hypothetical protein